MMLIYTLISQRPFELVERLRIPMGPRKKSKPNPEAATNNTQQDAPPSPNNQPQASTSTNTSASSTSVSKGPPPGDAQSVNVPVAPSLRDVGASQSSQSTPQLLSSPTTTNVQKS